MPSATEAMAIIDSVGELAVAGAAERRALAADAECCQTVRVHAASAGARVALRHCTVGVSSRDDSRRIGRVCRLCRFRSVNLADSVCAGRRLFHC